MRIKIRGYILTAYLLRRGQNRMQMEDFHHSLSSAIFEKRVISIIIGRWKGHGPRRIQ